MQTRDDIGKQEEGKGNAFFNICSGYLLKKGRIRCITTFGETDEVYIRGNNKSEAFSIPT